jgi:hypothetical protein
MDMPFSFWRKYRNPYQKYGNSGKINEKGD